MNLDTLKLMAAGGSIIATLYMRRRDLPVALGHCYAGTKPTETKRLEMLGRHFAALNTEGQIRARAELLDCRTQRRAHLFRGVA